MAAAPSSCAPQITTVTTFTERWCAVAVELRPVPDALTVALVLRPTVTCGPRPSREVDRPCLPMFNRMPGVRRKLWR